MAINHVQFMRTLCGLQYSRLGYGAISKRKFSVNPRCYTKKEDKSVETNKEKEETSAVKTKSKDAKSDNIMEEYKKFSETGKIRKKEDTVMDKEYSSFSDREPKDIFVEDPVSRIKRIFKYNLQVIKEENMARLGFEYESKIKNYYYGPNHADIVIIGGGAMGSSCAFWLKETFRDAVSVLVVEKDLTYKSASTSLSVGGLRQQFSLPESIQMSLYSAEFLRTATERLQVEGFDPPQFAFQPYGYLLLATEKGAEDLTENSKLQNSMGARNVLLTRKKLKERFPWLNTDDIALGCLGLEKEGWFDPWALLLGFKTKAINLGADYVNAEVVGFQFSNISGTEVPVTDLAHRRLDGVVVRRPDGKHMTINFSRCVIAAGAESGILATLAGCGSSTGLLAYTLPVEKRKRYVYCFHCPDGPGLNTPLTVDPTGTYFRREGLLNHYIAGLSPSDDEEPPTDNLDVDYGYFEEKVWPVLANRIPCFEKLKVKSGWAGFYEYNTFDMNGVIGFHPIYNNLYFACGFSGHGIQHAPAVGRAITELILHDEYRTIDLTRLEFRRFATKEMLKEKNIV